MTLIKADSLEDKNEVWRGLNCITFCCRTPRRSAILLMDGSGPGQGWMRYSPVSFTVCMGDGEKHPGALEWAKIPLAGWGFFSSSVHGDKLYNQDYRG